MRLRSGSLAAVLVLPSKALAEVCDKERSGWDGMDVTLLGEATTLFLTPLGLVLLVLTTVALRMRNHWVGLVAIVGWTVYLSIITIADPTGLRTAAMEEGCIGSPALFIALVTAICIGTAIYTTPRKADG